ncbi:ABC transporter permease [Virgibacillus halophilus]|uniref:ABC transporter permease n=2 Tax=Tigheibacillus halophilus TaxID=361280 RepID=A0ABU5C5V1_9BACI|nr:ABC transporter permease [Virgibacillus halophilus]
MLGIIIGVASVIALVSIGKSSTQSVTEQINGLGTNLLTVNVTDADQGDITNDDIQQVKKLNGVAYVAPQVSGRVTAKSGNTSSQVSLTGTTSAYQHIKGLSLTNGRFLSDLDDEYRQKIAVLGSETAENLFGTDNPVDQKIQLNGTSYKVVGVLASKGSTIGQSGDNTIIIPIHTAERLLQTLSIQSLSVQTTEGQINLVEGQLERLFYSLFNQDADSYTITNQQDVMDTMDAVNDTMTTLLAGIASISLLVGGIGIMNIMFVSVSERTKEIGIRKAIGARRKDILVQFLMEAIVLSAFGGVIGVAIGFTAAKLYAVITGGAFVLHLSLAAVPFLFSLFVGIVFGVFPANKASKLQPIYALRSE